MSETQLVGSGQNLIDQAIQKKEQFREVVKNAQWGWTKMCFPERPECPECRNDMVESRDSRENVKHELKLNRHNIGTLYVGFLCKNLKCKLYDKLKIEKVHLEFRLDKNGEPQFRKIHEKNGPKKIYTFS